MASLIASGTPQLIGRALQLEALQNILAEVRSGRGQAVLVSGEAGVGKSRLVREFQVVSNEENLVIFQGSCFEQDQVIPFAPLVDVLRQQLALQSAETSREVLDALAPELIKLLPELKNSLPDTRPSAELAPELEKRRLFETIIQALLALAEGRIILLLIEDIHWSDETSLDFLSVLARRLPSSPILLVLTTRLVDPARPLAEFLSQLNRERLAREIRLKSLSQSATAAMIYAMLGWEAHEPLTFLAPLHRLTDGLPYFVEEVVGSLVDRGDIYEHEGRWQIRPAAQLHIPASLRLVVAQQIERLEPPALQLLTLAAAVGRRFNFGLLAELTSHKEAELVRLIKSLVAARLVVEEAPDSFAFRHALTQEAIYSGLLARERRGLHEQIADYLRSHPELTSLSQMAYHFYEAQDWPLAVEYGFPAAQAALDRFAPYAALAQIERVSAAAEQLGQALAPAAFRLWGQAHQLIGEFEAALKYFEASRAGAQKAGDSRAEWQALIDLGFNWMTRDYARMGEYLRQALDLARRLDDPLVLAQSLNRLGNWEANIGQLSSAIGRHEEALVIAESADDDRLTAESLDLIATAHGIAGNMTASEANYLRALPLFEALGDLQAQASSMAMLSVVGHPEMGSRALDIAREIGWRDGEANANLRLSMYHADQGDLGPAESYGLKALAIAEAIGHQPWQTVAQMNIGNAYRLMQDFESAERHLGQALDLATSSGVVMWAEAIIYWLALALLGAGKVAEAEAVVSTVDAGSRVDETYSARALKAAQAEILLAQGQPQHGLDLLEPVFAANPELADNRDYAYMPLRILTGRLLADLDRTDEALTTLAYCLEFVDKWGPKEMIWKIEAERLKAGLGKLDHAAAVQSRVRAIEHIAKTANTISDPQRRAIFETQAVAQLPELSDLTELQSEKQVYAGLTRREREVVALVARGLSNKSIAEQLYITVRTTKSHMTNIMNKLKFNSRSQIAAWAVEVGLLDKNSYP
jgi:predicted ATPase/DNA-binding CsgD family transcriptional regulator